MIIHDGAAARLDHEATGMVRAIAQANAAISRAIATTTWFTFLPSPGALTNLGIRYSEVARHQEAVALAQEETVSLRQKLAVSNRFPPRLRQQLDLSRQAGRADRR